ncbi:MAG: DNA mismatch repair endonuclease MutL [Oscillospiraceae bacterium]|nr:DNA mismatch repair endonuclease MutL [Oscillospiraceae bacterium]
MQQRARIARLPEEVVGKIAAGEVVESPAAALKELLENSIDAGATAVTVETREGGITYLRVTDNGHGITAEDVRMAFERHATSKIRSAEDLFAVQSLGFRGEALASIAAVAKVTLTTRARQEDRGVRVRYEGGVMQDIRDAASPEGTAIIVEDLFFNTPARLKFLKKPATEGARVADMVSRILLCRPDISFRLVQNYKQVYHSPGDGKLLSAMYAVYGREAAAQLVPVAATDGGVRVSGLVGVGPVARGNRAHQSFFINGRFVRSPLLTQALEAACRERVVNGQFPLCALHIILPAGLVDVNVHPNKLEVRFSDEALVAQAVSCAVADALCQGPGLGGALRRASAAPPSPPVSQASPPQDAPSAPALPPESPETGAMPPRFADVVQSFFAGLEAPPLRVRETARSLPGQAQPPAFASHSPQAAPIRAQQPVAAAGPVSVPFRVIGVVFQTYILVECGDELLLIDQHAAHERMLYERLTRSLADGTGSQQLLTPLVVRVTPAERDRLNAYMDEVLATGFDLDFFDDETVRIRAVPVILGEAEAGGLFTALLDQLGTLRVLATAQKRREAIVQMACKRAVKGGDALDGQEIATLLAQMRDSDAPPTCPHGRPLVVVIPKRELEKRFKRIV